ncbi:FAD:protein FMN transferase [bacterium]|nr:FAD:protein FMN transferase [bacterium]
MKKRFLPVLLAAVALLPACRRAAAPAPYSHTRFLMDTIVTITVHDSGSAAVPVSEAVDRAFTVMADVEKTASAHLPESDLYRINAASFSEAVVPPELGRIIAAALAVSEKTGGAFDPTLGRVKDLWPFTTPDPAPPDTAAVRSVLAFTGYRHLGIRGDTLSTSRPGMELDLGGIAKGRAIDLAVSSLREAGISAGIVDAGGDLRIFGTPPRKPFWNIGIRDPRSGGEIFGVITTGEAAVATSGDYERFFIYNGKRYHHLLDPATGFPAAGTASVTIIAPSALEADAYATAVFIMGPERGMGFIEAEPALEGIIISRGNDSLTYTVSTGLKDNFQRLR